MTDRNPSDACHRVRSGRRLAVDIESPRDQTVCFTVSKEEKEAIDALAAKVGRTRSSILARMVVAFVEDEEGEAGAASLMTLLEGCRAGRGREVFSTRRI